MEAKLFLHLMILVSVSGECSFVFALFVTVVNFNLGR